MQLPFEINLLPDSSVVHKDGEYLGTWHIDEETDAFHVFVPDCAEGERFMDPNIPGLCERILAWMAARP
jgi:hypothetical protein